MEQSFRSEVQSLWALLLDCFLKYYLHTYSDRTVILSKLISFLSKGLSGLFINLPENRAVIFFPVEAFSGHVNDVVCRR
jgi:hypothetical protein